MPKKVLGKKFYCFLKGKRLSLGDGEKEYSKRGTLIQMMIVSSSDSNDIFTWNTVRNVTRDLA